MLTELIIGCGYLGRKVAKARQQLGVAATGVVRSESSVKALQSQGINALRSDLDREVMPDLQAEGVDVFYFAPPPGEGVLDTRVRNLVESFAQHGQPRRVAYLSTTGVYGDCKGEWVDENRPANPVVDRAKRRWDAEQVLRRWRETSGRELVILRVAGIYGPGKLPLDRLRKELPLIREAEAPFTNCIHADDLVQVCIAAMARGVDGGIYNVSDGNPGTMTDYFNRIADQAGLPRPPQIPMSEGEGKLSVGMMSYMAESRRLDNRKMLDELGVELKYPDLDSGLDACFE
ncbi:SDR family oxidoreductase [Solemya velesiana gill symbiont]|uniref:NAD(P)-dependent oxidoreductase n=1 Tax=Solemya velesiana gill symbiont TaxID=1918948 RepID=A0A1T2KUP7_9GAMM|nr:SDR family oxidoreductase [Solemya velesiana gill symbiont]OOZ36583.1 NAD(P)-dependent oxidoreductase [Solemya velesiana gill symbiont]